MTSLLIMAVKHHTKTIINFLSNKEEMINESIINREM